MGSWHWEFRFGFWSLFFGSGFDIYLWQAAVVAFLMHFLDYSNDAALAAVKKHPIADPHKLERDGGWFGKLALM